MQDHCYFMSNKIKSDDVLLCPDPPLESLSKESSVKNYMETPVLFILTLFLLYQVNELSRSAANGILHDIVQSQKIEKRGILKNTAPYSKRLMVFCLTLQGYSTRAYKFLRRSFENCLPHLNTLKNYRNKVDGSPGFSSPALQMIKNKANELKDKKLYVSLACDDISIKQHVWYNGRSFTGFADTGDGPWKEKAKHVMFLMVVALNSSWKLPVAYFLIPDRFSSKNRAELISHCILKLNETGAVLTNVVMDNCPVNYATYRELGCKLTRNPETLNTNLSYKNNIGIDVVALFDPPHLSKLVRNALGHWRTLVDAKNRLVKWKHIFDLYNHQKSEGFHLANKLTKQHIEFQKNPMKVKFAVQILSRSVANALLTMKDLKIDGFNDVEGTVDYLMYFDSIFDVMNSKSLNQSYLKSPLTERNSESWHKVFEETSDYICNLKTENGIPVLKSKRYAAFLGMNEISESSF